MDFKMDLQLFAEGESSETADNDTSTMDTDSADVDDDSSAEDIPEELGGVPEEIAREIMAEADNAQTDSSEDDSDDGDDDVDGAPDAGESHSDNNELNDNGEEPPINTKIPYQRFKQQVDKTRSLEAEIATLKQQLAAGKNQQDTPPNMQVTIPQGHQQQGDGAGNQQSTAAPLINADVAEQYKELVKAETMKMTGFSADDVDAIQYMDEDDSRLQTWNVAYKMAENSIQQKIEAARQQQMEPSRRVLAAHNQAVIDYNTFAQKEAAEHDFKEVQNYAINEFFEKNITKAEQPIIAAAYQRIERNVASPQDIMLIKRYFIDAKNAYRSQQGNKQPGGNTGRSNRLKQGKAFPRSSDIDGAGTDTGSVTNDTLAKMLEEKPFSEIPPEYQKMLLGY